MVLCFAITFVLFGSVQPAINCRDRSNHLRQDGGFCFEIPPWQHQPVEVEEHLNKIKDVWGNYTNIQFRKPRVALVNSEINRYMATVIAPFLDTYHRNIQTAYQQLTNKVLKRIKEEINAALRKKQKIYTELMALADALKVPETCDEERREARTLASRHVALTYRCTEDARASIAKMGKYAEEMISITRNHMQAAIVEATRLVDKDVLKANVTTCLKEISRAAASLGYELDLSLTNARRHNGQSCEKLASCCAVVRRNTDDEVATLKQYLYQCVYA